MSAGRFVTARYQADDTTSVYSCRVQPETLTATFDGTPNVETPLAVNQTVKAKVTAGRRGRGMHCRLYGFKFTGPLPDGYEGDRVYYLPVFRAATFRSLNPTSGVTGTYLGQPIEIVSKIPERQS